MSLLFPELDGSLNVVLLPPSKKSRRRFPDARKVEAIQVDKTIWKSTSFECVIKKHMQEVTSIYITRVPSLISKLQNLDERADAWQRYRAVLEALYGSLYKRVLLQAYLAANARRPETIVSVARLAPIVNTKT